MATLLPNGKQQFLDANGKPLASGSVYFYVPGTTTPKTTWQDSGQTILNTNPVVLDAAGEAVIYGSGAYRQIVKDSLGVTIWDQLTADYSSAGTLWGGTSGGSANAQTITVAGFSLITGNTVEFKAGYSNSGATTLNVNSLGATQVYRDSGSGPTPLTGREIIAGNVITVVYDSGLGGFHLISPWPDISDAPVMPKGALNSRTLKNELYDRGLNLMDYGAVPNDTSGSAQSANVVAIRAWFADVLAQKRTGYAPGGEYWVNDKITFDYKATQYLGFTIVGDGVQKTIFHSSYSVAGDAAFEVLCSGGTAAAPVIGVYPSVTRMGFKANFAGATFQVGTPKTTGYPDQQNRGWLDIWALNESDSPNVSALKLNNLYGWDIAWNGVIGTTSAAGDALILNQVSFCKFWVSGGSTADAFNNPVGNAIGVHMRDGFCYGNTFISPDFEILHTAVVISSSAAQNNAFVGGTFAGLIDFVCRANAGSNNRFYVPNKNTPVPFFAHGADAVGVSKELPDNLAVLAPASGDIISFAEDIRTMKITTGALASLNIQLPTNPGDCEQVSFQTVSAIAATAFYPGAFSGDTIIDPPASLPAAGACAFQYSAAGACWYRLR